MVEYNGSGGGAGMPGGKGRWYNSLYDKRYSGENGTGGLLIFYANNFIMNESGNISTGTCQSTYKNY